MPNPWYAPNTFPGLQEDQNLFWPPEHSKELTGGLPLVTKSKHPFVTRKEAQEFPSNRTFNWRVFDLTKEQDSKDFTRISNEGINGTFCHILMRKHFWDDAKPENVKVYMEWVYYFKSDTRAETV